MGLVKRLEYLVQDDIELKLAIDVFRKQGIGLLDMVDGASEGFVVYFDVVE